MPSTSDTVAFLVSWIEERSGADVSQASSFMEAGLDSFDIVALVDALRDFAGMPELSILEVFSHPTVEELARHASVDDGPGSDGLADGLLAWVEERTGRSGIEAATPFGELGLDSFDIVALADHVRELTGDESFSLLAVLEYPSIELLVAHIGGGSDEADESAQRVILKATGAPVGPPSFAQETLLSWEAKREPSPTFTSGVRVRIEGPLDVGLARAALDAFAARQAALRLVAVRGEKVLSSCAPEDIPLRVLDFDGHGEAALERAYRDIMGVPFLLDGQPLVSAWLLRRSSADHTLVLCWHHLVHDATGGYLLVKQFLAHYRAVATGRPVELPDLPVSYADFVAWEREYWRSDTGSRAVEAARARIADAKPLRLPRRVPGMPCTARAHGRFYRLPDDASARFLQLCEDLGATHFALTTAATAVMLHRETGADEVVMIAPVAARVAPEVSELVGKFGSRVPLRIDLRGNPAVRDLVRQVTNQTQHLLSPVPGRLVFDIDDVFEHPLAGVVINAPSLEVNEVTYDPPLPGIEVFAEALWQPKVSPPHLATVVVRLGSFIGLKVVGQAALYDENDIARHLTTLRLLFERMTVDSHVSDLT